MTYRENEKPLEPPVKRSLTIAGHRTSISLEQPFWEALQDIAVQKKLPLAALVAQIDETSRNCGLSSVLRVYVLNHHRDQNQKET